MSKIQKSLLFIFVLLLIDQVIKIWVKTTLPYGHGFEILGLHWAQIHFIENPGMAFGQQFGGLAGKYILTAFRYIAIIAIGWYLFKISKEKYHRIIYISISMIFAGALGNALDSTFYGLIFDSGPQWSPEHNRWVNYAGIAAMNGDGYGGLMSGSVVDMFYFPMFSGTYPDWVPFKGGSPFTFFSPVFNFADSCISVGTALILIFWKKFTPLMLKEKKNEI